MTWEFEFMKFVLWCIDIWNLPDLTNDAQDFSGPSIDRHWRRSHDADVWNFSAFLYSNAWKALHKKISHECISVVTSNTADTMEGVFNGALSHARLLRLDSSMSKHLPQPLRLGTRPASASTGPDVNHLRGTQLINPISSSPKLPLFSIRLTRVTAKRYVRSGLGTWHSVYWELQESCVIEPVICLRDPLPHTRKYLLAGADWQSA